MLYWYFTFYLISFTLSTCFILHYLNFVLLNLMFLSLGGKHSFISSKLPVFTWRHGGHVSVTLTREFWLFLLFGTPTWPYVYCLLYLLGLLWSFAKNRLRHLRPPARLRQTVARHLCTCNEIVELGNEY